MPNTNPTTCTRCNGIDALGMGEDAHWRGCLRGEDGRELCVRCEGTGEEPEHTDCDCDRCIAAYDLTDIAAIAA